MAAGRSRTAAILRACTTRARVCTALSYLQTGVRRLQKGSRKKAVVKRRLGGPGVGKAAAKRE
eukprot:365120-Chlamydomonas_euryale.AAC.6